MKATEVLSKYAAGSRKFHGVKLRGQSFRGKNLQGADFSRADLRGTNFKDANLQGVDFTRAKAGLQKRWAAFLLGMSCLAAIFSGFCSILIAATLEFFFQDIKPQDFYIGLFGFIFVGIFLIIAFRKDLIAVVVAFSVALFGFYICWRALKGDERDAWVRSFAVDFAATGGTSFNGANLTKTNFTGATLKNTDFRQAILIGTCFSQAQKLDLARPGKTYLASLKVQQWLIGTGTDNNFDRLNLCGVNFQGKNLTEASFVGADLSEANLQGADLSRAILVQTQLDHTDFNGATLTGAFIEDWGITADTELEGVQCDYIFTRLPPDKRPKWLTLSDAESQNLNPQRKPDDWDRNFEAGEFADFITPLRKTLLDLYHNQPVDPRLTAIAFQDLQQKHPQAELELVSVTKTGKNRDKLHLQAATSPTADVSSLHGEYFTNFEYYQSLSPEAQEALLIERGATLKMVLEGGSKININNSPQQKNNSTMSQTTQSHSGSGDNVADDKNLTFV